MNVVSWLGGKVQAALVEVYGPEFCSYDPLLTPATRLEFGDYQCNIAMSLGKQLKVKPRDVASAIADALDIEDVFEPVEIAGPGFLNLRLKRTFLQAELAKMLTDEERCAVSVASLSQVTMWFSLRTVAACLRTVAACHPPCSCRAVLSLSLSSSLAAHHCRLLLSEHCEGYACRPFALDDYWRHSCQGA